jgi:hypothetical protein
MADRVFYDRFVRYAGDFVAFAADLHVPLGAASGRLGDHWAEFQRTDFAAMAPSLLALARGKVPKLRRFWIERTKGGSKDSDVAVANLWLQAFAPRSIRIQVGAFDQQQASEIRDIIRAILAIDAPLNRLLAGVVEVQKYSVVAHANTAGRSESVCEILTTDAYGSHGARPDVVIANELTHVQSEAFMQTLLDNADKIPHALVIIATNSGEVGSWQEKWRDIARDSDRWRVSVLNEPAPWVSADDLAESQRRNPPHRFARLWRGVWSSGEGDGLNPADIAACTTLQGPQHWRSDRIYLAGLDLGINRDHSALCILAADPRRGMVELAALWSWNPADYPDHKVDLIEIRHVVSRAHDMYQFVGCKYDFWQAEYMAQELRADGVPMSETKMPAEDLNLIVRSLLDAFSSRRIALYPHEDLQRDLLRIRIKETLRGFKLDAVRDDAGHADRAMALAFCLPAAMAYATRYQPEPEPAIEYAAGAWR